jgi:hypothetical protein
LPNINSERPGVRTGKPTLLNFEAASGTSMNPLLNPTTPRPDRPNLEKVHKLVQSQKNHAASSDSSKPGLPTNWFYGEFAAARFWHDLEAQDMELRL